RVQLVRAFGGLGREEFEAQGQGLAVVGGHGALAAFVRGRLAAGGLAASGIGRSARTKNSRLPSPPAIGLSKYAATCSPASRQARRKRVSTSAKAVSSFTRPPLAMRSGCNSNWGL